MSFKRTLSSHKSSDLEQCFNACFKTSYATVLKGGAKEPLYLPRDSSKAESITDKREQHIVYYRSDYFSSALHEIAHWCLAGEARRQILDYGYWYLPDGRNAEQQTMFEQVEVKPQALECAFTRMCGLSFRVSIDNLGAEYSEQIAIKREEAFAKAVEVQYLQYQNVGYPRRAAIFLSALKSKYAKCRPLPEAQLQGHT
jgi:elongation factor P hydroxylase